MKVVQLIPFQEISKTLAAYVSERRDLNPRPPLPQSGTLPSCATPRFYEFLSYHCLIFFE